MSIYYKDTTKRTQSSWQKILRNIQGKFCVFMGICFHGHTMPNSNTNVPRKYIKKRRIVISTTQSLLNLKSNTMKNTVQRYCFFWYPPNVSVKKYVFQHKNRNFANSTLQKNDCWLKKLAKSQFCTNFVLSLDGGKGEGVTIVEHREPECKKEAEMAE